MQVDYGKCRDAAEAVAPWPVFDEEQVRAVAEVLRSGRINYWTGNEGLKFESEFAAWCGTKRALAVCNGTASLELIVRGLRLMPGDEVITTPRTFVATSGSLVANFVHPVFADVGLDSGNITPESVAPLITDRTRAILAVHLGGWPCDLEGLRDLADSHGLHLIEDCAQAHGAAVNDRPVGSWGKAASWSFCQDKIMTTGGEGGMVATNDEELWKTMWSIRDHGKSYDIVHKPGGTVGFKWIHENWGTNWRLTEMQSVIGRIQLRRIATWTKERARNAAHFVSRLSNLNGIRIPLPDKRITHAFYRLYAYVEEQLLKDGWCRDRILEECEAHGLTLSVGSCSEVYLEKCFKKCDLAPQRRLPNAAELSRTAIALKVHPGTTEDQIDRESDILESVLRRAVR
ncbi:MAG: DegT/DnrJ/EryC1/StrS family aminotransferase [Fimbriimonadaceae bacterium]